MTFRYYLDAPLLKGEKIDLSKEEKHHLEKVLRTKPGETIEISNGRGFLAKAIYDKDLTIDSVEFFEKSSPMQSLALAITEQKHLEIAIEKGTEIGIDTFYLFAATRSTSTHISTNKRSRLSKITISAMKQSKRLYLPAIVYLDNKTFLPKNANYLLADFDGGAFTKTDVETTFIVGPESGFSKDEIAYFKETLAATKILLSKNVLRTETAAIISASYLMLGK